MIAQLCRIARSTPLRAYILAMLLASPNSVAQADTNNNFEQTHETKILGSSIGASVQAGVPTGSNRVQSGIGLKILGAAIQALMAFSQPPDTVDGVTYTEFYSFGKRIFSESSYFNNSGGLSYAAGITPVQVRVPVVMYPVGPLVLELDAGARFQAGVEAILTPTLDADSIVSELSAHLGALVGAAGFVEGYVKFLILRGGVGGQLDLVDAKASVDARVSFNGNPVIATVSAMAQFLKGRVYAFLDLHSIIPWGWRRLLNYDIYHENGFCFATGGIMCPSN